MVAPSGTSALTILYTAIGALAALSVFGGALYGAWHHAKKRYGHPWRYVVGTPADEETGTPKQLGLIEAVFGDASDPERWPGLLRSVATIEAQVCPNGGQSRTLGDTVKRVELRVAEVSQKLSDLSQHVDEFQTTTTRRLAAQDRKLRELKRQ